MNQRDMKNVECVEISKPDSIAVLAIDSDGNLIIVDDEAWRFQFIPRVN